MTFVRRAFALAFACILLVTPALAAERRVAMVVGNSAYENAPALPNTINDAKAVADSLGQLGFEVFTAYDATQQQLLQVLGDYTAALRNSDAALFFYAGHGMQLGNDNYILPTDISVKNELSVRYGALDLSDVLRDIESLSKVAIVILDACRDNPFAAQLRAAEPGRSVASTRGLAPMVAGGTGTIIAYAAAPGMVASDGAGKHSPYTQALLDEMAKPGVEIGLMFRRVAGDVIKETSGQQRPDLLVRLASEFYLAGVPQPVLVAENTQPPVSDAMPAPVDMPGAPVVAAPAVERQAWQPDVAPGDRAALWGYMANYLATPLFAPNAPWQAPDAKPVAEAEPNSSFGAAQDVEVNDSVTLSIAPQGDNDWVRFAVGEAGTLSVKADGPPAEIDLALRVVGANGDEVAYWQSAPRPGGTLDVKVDLPRPGTYYLQLADSNNDAWSPTAFPVALSFVGAGDGFEPNNGIGSARHIGLDGIQQIAVLPKGDHDWFRFETDKPGALFVALSGVPENIDAQFHLMNADGVEQVYWVSAPRPGGDTSAVLDLPRPGVYYLDIGDGNNDQSSPLPLTLLTRFAASPDTAEPSDSMAQAIAVKTDSHTAMAIFPKGDTDWLAVDVQQPGELRLDIKSPPQNLDLQYHILDASGAEIQYWTFAPRPGGDVVGSVDLAKPGRYYIQVADGNNDAGSVEPYALDLGFTASLDAFEPNDGIGSARPVTPGGSVPFTILPKGDTDWFRLSVDQPGELQIKIEDSPPNLDLTYRVVGTDWAELQYWVPPYAKGGLTEGFVDLPRPGTYFIQVVDGNNDDRSIEPATLSTVFTPTPASNEPNNTFGEATLVSIDGETLAQILPKGDTDWQVFHADGPGRLEVTIDQVPETLDIQFRVVNADQQEIQYWISAPRPGGVTTGTVAIPAAGWYWLQLQDGNNDGRSPQPFRVTRTFTGG